MTSTVMSNVNQALSYAASELGEALTIASNGTVSSKKANNGATVLALGTSQAAALTHVLSVHPQIGKITG